MRFNIDRRIRGGRLVDFCFGILRRVKNLPLRITLVAMIPDQAEARCILEFVSGVTVTDIEGAAKSITAERGESAASSFNFLTMACSCLSAT
jgi:hypothetical protein